MSIRSIYIKGIGECILRKTKRSRRLRISIKLHEKILVSIPFTYSFDAAVKFVISKKDWIDKTQQKFQKIKKTVFTPNSTYSTNEHILKIEPCENNMLKASIKSGFTTVYVPRSSNIESEQIQEFIQKALIETYRIEAKKYLPGKVRKLAMQHNYSYNKVFIKNHTSRWGSCSVKNNINLNLHLMRLPEHLIEYVILHELAHTVHKNHSEKFWHELNSTTHNNAKSFQKEIRKYHLYF